MRRSLILAVCLVAGCSAKYAPSSGTAAEVNIHRMSQICLGMTEEDVLQIMHHPIMDEKIITEDASYDIQFYVTRSPVLGEDELVPQNLTPLIFKNGILVGRGHDYYTHLLAKRVQTPAVSMCSRPAPEKKDPPPNPDEKPDEPPPDQEKKYGWDKEDDRMIEQGEEQNFDYW